MTAFEVPTTHPLFYGTMIGVCVPFLVVLFMLQTRPGQKLFKSMSYPIKVGFFWLREAMKPLLDRVKGYVIRPETATTDHEAGNHRSKTPGDEQVPRRKRQLTKRVVTRLQWWEKYLPWKPPRREDGIELKEAPSV
jgi:hypothetical protein